MYTFEYEETEQTSELTDYRYIGNEPDNYVYFNCEDEDNVDTCEIWRIIGVFDVEDSSGSVEQRIKIVRDSSVSVYHSWDDDYDNVITSLNKWDLDLNNYYIKLFDMAKDLIGNDKFKYYQNNDSWKYEESNIEYGSALDMYIWEREPEEERVIETLNMALMYPSDYAYTYALGIDDKFFSDVANCSLGSPEKGWIYNSNRESTQWLWTDGGKGSLIISSSGEITDEYVRVCGMGCWDNSYGVRPVTYLKSNIYIDYGDGSEDNPYRLSLISKITSNNKYKEYNIGDIVEYDNSNYYVLSKSSSKLGYVKLLKAEPLTTDEINTYNDNDYISESGEMSYYENENCNNENTISCLSNYNNSNIKEILEKWVNKYIYELEKIDGYRVRLIKLKELINLGYEDDGSDSPNAHYVGSEDTPEWLNIAGKPYWTMNSYEDSNTQVYGVSNTLTNENVYNKLYIRPVINLKKCAIDNSCND